MILREVFYTSLPIEYVGKLLEEYVSDHATSFIIIPRNVFLWCEGQALELNPLSEAILMKVVVSKCKDVAEVQVEAMWNLEVLEIRAKCDVEQNIPLAIHFLSALKEKKNKLMTTAGKVYGELMKIRLRDSIDKVKKVLSPQVL